VAEQEFDLLQVASILATLAQVVRPEALDPDLPGGLALT
jgi:hypothetical protein